LKTHGIKEDDHFYLYEYIIDKTSVLPDSVVGIINRLSTSDSKVKSKLKYWTPTPVNLVKERLDFIHSTYGKMAPAPVFRNSPEYERQALSESPITNQVASSFADELQSQSTRSLQHPSNEPTAPGTPSPSSPAPPSSALSAELVAPPPRKEHQKRQENHLKSYHAKYSTSFEKLKAVQSLGPHATDLELTSSVDYYYTFLVLSSKYEYFSAIGSHTFDLAGIYIKIIVGVDGLGWLHVYDDLSVPCFMTSNWGDTVLQNSQKKTLARGYYYIGRAVNVALFIKDAVYRIVIPFRNNSDRTKLRKHDIGDYFAERPSAVPLQIMEQKLQTIPREMFDRIFSRRELVWAYFDGQTADDSAMESLINQAVLYCNQDLDSSWVGGGRRIGDFDEVARQIDFMPTGFWSLAPFLHVKSSLCPFDKMIPTLHWYRKYTIARFGDWFPKLIRENRPSGESAEDVSVLITSLGFYKPTHENINCVWDRLMAQAFGDFFLSSAVWCIDRKHHEASKSWYMKYPLQIAKACVRSDLVESLVGEMKKLFVELPHLTPVVLLSAYIVYNWAIEHGLFSSRVKLCLGEFVVTAHQSLGMRSPLKLPLTSYTEINDELKKGRFAFNFDESVIAIARYYAVDLAAQWKNGQRLNPYTFSIGEKLEITSMNVADTARVLTLGISQNDETEYEPALKRRKISDVTPL
tara:strand:+ start:3311 stop:5383 length:2073 start_codon:yes stop_codon:yes gene_type:complete